MTLVERCPGVKFVVDHMAKPDVTGEKWDEEEKWLEGMSQLSKHSNVHCKVSGFYAGINICGPIIDYYE